jgi:hypothetical protein
MRITTRSISVLSTFVWFIQSVAFLSRGLAASLSPWGCMRVARSYIAVPLIVSFTIHRVHRPSWTLQCNGDGWEWFRGSGYAALLSKERRNGIFSLMALATRGACGTQRHTGPVLYACLRELDFMLPRSHVESITARVRLVQIRRNK